jgi:hypothetical protein
MAKEAVPAIFFPVSKKFGSQGVTLICSFVLFISTLWLILSCHRGGGVKDNDTLDSEEVPVLWMGNEAGLAGLRLLSPKKEWVRDGQWRWEDLENIKPTESLHSVWHVCEILPIKRLSYSNKSPITRYELP